MARRSGGLAFGTDPKAAGEVTAAVRAATSLPVVIKLTPNTSDIGSIAKAVEEAGADILTVINTLRGIVIDIPNRRPLIANTVGGLSGPAIKPVAVCMVWQVYEAVKIPIIGCGGITTGLDAVEFLMAGATAVQVGTASLSNPRGALNVLEGLQEFAQKEGVKKITDLIGVAHPR